MKALVSCKCEMHVTRDSNEKRIQVPEMLFMRLIGEVK
jgi:hypothetical protein